MPYIKLVSAITSIIKLTNGRSRTLKKTTEQAQNVVLTWPTICSIDRRGVYIVCYHPVNVCTVTGQRHDNAVYFSTT